MVWWAVFATAVLIGAAVGLAAALSGMTEGFEERLDDLSWTAQQGLKRH